MCLEQRLKRMAINDKLINNEQHSTNEKII